MNRRKIIAIAAGIIVAAAFVIRLKSNKDKTEGNIYYNDKHELIYVEADTINQENINPAFSYPGTFEPNRETKISSEIQGKINEVLVDLGHRIKKGDALIQLDNSLLKLQVQSVELQIEGLETDVKRYMILAKADAIQAVQLEKAELGLKSAQIQKAILLEQLAKTTIRAPFDGIVTAKLTEAGAFASPGVPLLQVTDMILMKFTVNISENDLGRFFLNESYPVAADVYPEIKLNGTVTMTGSKANSGNSFPVQLTVTNTPDLKIKSGMFGKVTWFDAKMKNNFENKGIIIPSSALVGTGNLAQVYVVKNGKSVLQKVTVAKRFGNRIQISEGLNEGDVIITKGFINLYDGANVSVK